MTLKVKYIEILILNFSEYLSIICDFLINLINRSRFLPQNYLELSRIAYYSIYFGVVSIFEKKNDLTIFFRFSCINKNGRACTKKIRQNVDGKFRKIAILTENPRNFNVTS